MTGLDELKNLRAILTSSLDNIISFCEGRKASFPSLFSPADPSVEFSPTGLRNAPELADAFSLGISAAAQVVATLQSPALTAVSSSARHILPACISVVERTNVPEILREAGPGGMHAKEIAAKSNIDPKKLARILRYLSTNYVFKEVSPDDFAHNLVSSCLDTGKSFEEICKDPSAKFDNTIGVQAFSSLLAEDVLRAAANLLPNIIDPATAFSDEENAGPMQRAFNSNVNYWVMLEQPGEENHRRFRRMNAAMEGSAKTQPPKAVLQLFDWGSVPQGGMLVDVGAGLGNISLEVSKVRPDMHFVVEDRPQVIERAKAYWETAAPDFVASGHVHFNGFDFLTARPARLSSAKPDVILLRIILHDSADKYALKLLKNLRSISGAETKLVVVDTIMGYACRGYNEEVKEKEEPPEPLLAKLGATSAYASDMDITMMLNLNASERTLADFRALFAASGWELKEVHRHPGANKMLYPAIVAVPV